MDREQYAAYLAIEGLADSSIRMYVSLWTRWCDWATTSQRDPLAPDPLAVRAWATSLPGSSSTRSQARAAVGHACRALGLDDVSSAIPVPRAPRRHSKALSEAATVRLARCAHSAGIAGVAVLVGLYTAARRSEIATLSWPRIDLDGGTVTLVRPKTRDLHRVPLHPVLSEVLGKRRIPGAMWVFNGRHGGHIAPAMVWEWVISVGEQAEVGHVTPHVLRHTALTWANDRTHDLRAVQDLAGHTNPAVTARYTRTSTDAMRAVVDSLDYDSTWSGAS